MSQQQSTPSSTSPTSSADQVTTPHGSAEPDRTTASTPAATTRSEKDPLRGSRASGVWVFVSALVVLLALLAIFVLQNTQSVEVSFLGWSGQAPLATTLIIATAAGMLIAVMAGTLRILQLRRRVKREHKRAAKG